MTETLISELSKVRSLRVISRTSVMHYKKQPKPLKTVAQELDVEAVVEGSTQRLGERAHVTARLIDAATERPLWSEDFDRDTGDVITLHRELARAIAREIRATLSPGEEKSLSPARNARPEAVEAYLRGMHLVNKGPQNLREAVKLAREAIRLDPDYARGHYLAGKALQGRGDFAQAPYAEVVRETRAELRKAIELEPDLADAYSLLSWSYVSADRDWEAAEQAGRKAKELDPTSDISGILFARGKVEEALAENRQVLSRDPLSVSAMTNVGRHLATLDRFDESLEWHRKALAVEPENAYAKSFFIWSAVQAGKLDVAAEALVDSALPENREVLRAAYGKGGWEALCRERVRLVLSRPNPSAQLIARDKLRYGVFLKDNEMALDGLEKLEKMGDSWLAQLADGGFRALRHEPRFKALLQRLRYPESMWK